MQALHHKHGISRSIGCRQAQVARPASSRVQHPCRLGLKRSSHIVFSASPPPETSEQQEAGPAGGKSIDAAGAGKSSISPAWLTQLNMLWSGKGNIPVADAKPDDIQDLLGGALFQALYKWMTETGPVYLLPTGPVSSFLVISDPAAAKQVLRASDNPQRNVYVKGLVAEVAEFLFGDGFAIAGGDLWRARRKAVAPSLHKAYLSTMIDRVFGPSALFLVDKLKAPSKTGAPVNMEAAFSQLTLDVIGKAVFNYDFDALTTDSPIIQAVYTALKETESRATDLLPYWKIPFIAALVPRQRKAQEAVALIRQTTNDLIRKCKVSSTQLRDDLLSMLVAGHETTGSALTWTLHLLVQNPDKMAKAQAEIDAVLKDRPQPTFEDYRELRYVTRCVPASQDVMISVYNIHHSKAVWDDPEAFQPERFGPLDGPTPNEQNTDYRYIPFSGGPRKCVGDQFAMMEAVVALSVLLKNFNFELVPNQTIGMTTGATIHTTNGLYMTVKERTPAAAALAGASA
ncbi:CYP97C3 [Dunaliella salina]|uniref:CYP97C3 n=1 Tax=Dunaliella salina TaxID=3046 RepID=A0ABQ7G4B1_DUNSA|nr:CYP97C3 [Dunaliella salina]|eukprot:KAF5829446.1 CYP97C3 [Dunaliella salina]